MFKPYKGSDCHGYIKINNVWMILKEHCIEAQSLIGEKYFIEFLGWGDTYGGNLSEYSKKEQELLKTTLK